MPASLSVLDHLAVLRATGPDRVTVLQGQTSNDAHRVDASRSQLTSFNDPKGRCYAVAVLAARGDEHLLVVEREVIEALCKRLRMYVLRSKAAFEPAEDLTVLGEAAAPSGPWACAGDAERLRIALPDGRGLVVAPRATAADLPHDDGSWRRADVAAGWPCVLAATAGRFVPLWLGLERFGAIDYRKGCYTGQEIVARTHYLGVQKQHLHRARCASRAAAGDKVVGPDGNALGEVVIAAPDAAGDGCTLLMVVRDAASHRLKSADGPALEGVSAFD